MKVTAEFEIDETNYALVCKREDIKRLADAVNAIYGKVWCEACYDPYNAQTEKMAKELLPHIEAVKSILNIKKS